MKKLLAIVTIASFLMACNEETKTESTTTGDSLTNEANKMADSANAMMNHTSDSVNKMTDSMHMRMADSTSKMR